jgi:filamin
VRVNTVSKSGEGQVHAPAFHGDASKVECKGLGMKKSFAGRMSQFNVDATKAGASVHWNERRVCACAGEDMLLIAVMGPKGFPCEELHVKHMGRGNYQVNYKITEKGMWFIHVKYGENHVPGSPFQLVV